MAWPATPPPTTCALSSQDQRPSAWDSPTLLSSEAQERGDTDRGSGRREAEEPALCVRAGEGQSRRGQPREARLLVLKHVVGQRLQCP